MDAFYVQLLLLLVLVISMLIGVLVYRKMILRIESKQRQDSFKILVQQEKNIVKKVMKERKKDEKEEGDDSE